MLRGVGLPCGAMDVELTNDEHLRALSALEAVVGNNDDALSVLAGGMGKRRLPALLAAFTATVQRLQGPECR